MPSAGLYNLYIVDPSEQNILAYTPARDGSGFPVNPQNRLTVARDVSKVNDLVIDGDIFVADGGSLYRFVGGKSEGWETQPPGYSSDARDGDTLLRAGARTTPTSPPRATSGPASSTPGTRTTAGSSPTTRPRARSSSSTASPAAARRWDDVRGMYVVLGSGPEAPSTLVWATKDGVMSAVLEAVPDAAPGASGSPNPSASAPAASAKPSAKPTKATPKPTKRP